VHPIIWYHTVQIISNVRVCSKFDSGKGEGNVKTETEKRGQEIPTVSGS
jgi:hypothetical protein